MRWSAKERGEGGWCREGWCMLHHSVQFVGCEVECFSSCAAREVSHPACEASYSAEATQP